MCLRIKIYEKAMAIFFRRSFSYRVRWMRCGWETHSYNKKQKCPLCGNEIKLGYGCQCSMSHNVDIYITFINLKKNPQVADLIYKLKYSFIEDVSIDLAKIVFEFLRRNGCIKPPPAPPCKGWEIFRSSSVSCQEGSFGENPLSMILNTADIVFIPIPLHKRRLLWRGFNQAELIVEKIRKISDESGQTFARFPIEKNIIVRKKNTSFQGKNKMTAKKRAQNIKGAFYFKKFPNYLTSTVVLFDDVITTGATMEECAKLLKDSGVKRVIAMAVGKG